ncbi:hypothetical protein CEXT_608311 [Caerostris extrusa]|uniref:Uncharacterized protein n=1 Tax=Caerostris extrusa TaxID=172846 RepID=A0AAV4TDC8_CAEEX|nr:hypothetical protein CEXT_608311 [Caerostris extrusa]
MSPTRVLIKESLVGGGGALSNRFDILRLAANQRSGQKVTIISLHGNDSVTCLVKVACRRRRVSPLAVLGKTNMLRHVYNGAHQSPCHRFVFVLT